jgi:uncharacterized protein YecT (DUF1311 family)
MRRTILLLLMLLMGASISSAQTATPKSVAMAASAPQIDQSRNSCSDYLKVKKGLEDMVKNIQDEYAKYPLFLKKFQKAQDEWVSYRDAQLEMLYPELDKTQYGGFYPTCRCNWLVEFTNERVDFLVKFISNTNDVEACGGAANSKKRKSFTTFNQ